MDTPSIVTNSYNNGIPNTCDVIENLTKNFVNNSIGNINDCVKHFYLYHKQHSSRTIDLLDEYSNTQKYNKDDFGDDVFSCEKIKIFINDNNLKDCAELCNVCPWNKDKEKDKIEEFDNTRNSIIMYLATKQRLQAIEACVSYIENTETINTIRTDKIRETFIYKEGFHVSQGKSYIEEIVRNLTGTYHASKFCNDVIDRVQIDTFINAKNFFINEDLNLIPVQNGIINIKTKTLLPFDKKYFFFGKLPVIYNKNAKCPNFINHLKNVLPDYMHINLIQEIIGWCLYRDYIPEKAIMMLGKGRNGKSKTLEVIKYLLGAENCVNISPKRLEKDNFSKGFLLNKLANLGSDIGNETLVDTSLFKELVGHDLISAARKNRDDIEFVNYCKMIFSANELPKTKDTSPGFMSKWVIIDFPYTFVEKEVYDTTLDKKYIKLCDKEIINKLTTSQELSGVLNFGLEGLDKLINNKFEFCITESTENIKLKWIRKSDSFMAFILDEIESSINHYITKHNLTQIYKIYCEKHKIISCDTKHIMEILIKEMGADSRRVHDVYSWGGIKWKKEDEKRINTLIINLEEKKEDENFWN